LSLRDEGTRITEKADGTADPIPPFTVGKRYASETIVKVVSFQGWLDWARRVQALAQNGLTYTEGAFDRERYLELRRIAAEMLAAVSVADADRIEELLSMEEGYATPKVDVRGVVLRGDGILLVREAEDGLWTLPGGWADGGNTPSEAVVAEIREESGYETRAVRLLAVLDRDRHGHPPLRWHVYKLFVLCELIGGEPRHSLETTGVGFFHPDALPPLSLGRVTAGQIRRMLALAGDPSAPPDLD
jgi:ADP-ribose pyrophosphatase YjhB (NUDIX family)